MQIVGAVINIILDPIFIFGYFGLPAMGSRGAAIATVTGQIVAMLLGLYFNLTKNKDVQLNFKLQTFVYMAIFGLNNALIPIVAFNLGAKHANRIKKVIRLSGVLCFDRSDWN